jgi:Uma2 family endonuclease
MIATENIKKPAPKRTRKVPANLIWEVLDGQPLYRRGYKSVMNKQKTIEEIMGTSSYQSLINSYILSILFSRLQLNTYDILTNEPGVHFEKNDNISNDIAIYNHLSSDQISKKYTDFHARIVIEIDIDIDPESMRDLEYLTKKTQKMLDFGVEKVIWILSYIRKVMVATPGNPWQTMDWSNDVEILDGISFNIQHFLTERGINDVE